MKVMSKFFSTKSMIDESEIQGKVLSSKKIYKDYWNVAGPAAIEGVLLNLMLLADLIMVGTLGIEQVAAVGVVSQPKMILQMFGSAIGVAVTAIVSRRKGENDIEGMNSSIKQSLLVTTLLYFVLCLLGIMYAENFVLIAGANVDYIGYATTYFQYIVISILFKSITVVLSSAQIGVGNTRIVLISSFIGNFINVILNYTLIFGKFGFPELGIKGAAIATVIGNIIIFIILLISMFKGKNGIDLFSKGTFKVSKRTLNPLVDIGGSSFMEHIFERIGLFIFGRIIASLGTVAMGTHHYCIIMWDLYYYFGIGMSSASSSFAGRKLGEKRQDLAIIYNKVAQKSGLVVSIISALVFVIIRKPVFNLIVSDNRVITLGITIIGIISIVIIPQTQAQVTSGTLRGAGDNRFIAVYSLFISAILRPAAAFIFAYSFNLGLSGMWLALLLDEVLKMILAQYRIKQGIWLEKQV